MHVQKGTQRIEVIVRKDSSGLLGANEKGADEQQNEEVSNTNGGGTRKTRMRRILLTNATHGLATARQVGLTILHYRIGGIGYESGDQALQDRVQRVWEIVEDVSGFAGNISRGAVFGAWGVPMGMVAGMTFAAITSASSLSAKYEGRQREFNYKVFKENNAIEYRRARANINLTNGRLR